MRYATIALLLILLSNVVLSQDSNSREGTVLSYKDGTTTVQLETTGQLQINVPPVEVRRMEERGYASYNDFGATGNDKTDDFLAIVATHAFANKHSLPVKTVNEATYYISGKNLTAIIQTDTDFGTAEFIINDKEVENRNADIFLVRTNLEPFKLEGISSLKRNQKKIDIDLSSPCLVTVSNSNVKHYIRYGPNQNAGSPQTDIFIVDKDGNVDMNAPIVWDFDEITAIKALPMDETKLTITGGVFTTIANQAESKYTYYSRGLAIRRSNVLVQGLEHRVIEELDHGAPYGGFIKVNDCAYVTVKNTVLTGHKTYRTIGSAGAPVSMGTYDISLGRSLNVSFINCRQTNDINDRTYWGIMGSNYCKNLLLDSCEFSRFDAHKGVPNATVRNSTIGHMGINAIGSGTFTVENCTIRGRRIMNLRSDYGSTWQGEFIIRDCVYIPTNEDSDEVTLIHGSYSGLHDFGYTCYMPERITIENLHIDDSKLQGKYKGPAIFSDFNSNFKDDSYQEKYPYIRTREVILKNVTSSSEKSLRISENKHMFRNIEIVRK